MSYVYAKRQSKGMKPNTQKQKLSTYERNKNMTQKKNERGRVTLVRREGKRFRERNTRISYYYDYYVHYYKHVYVYGGFKKITILI